MKAVFQPLRRFWKAGFFSPEAFVVRAIALSVFYGISRSIGLEEYTAFLSGTTPAGNLSWETAAILGLIHLLLHVAFILFVPIFLITAALLATWHSCPRQGAPSVTHNHRSPWARE